MSTFMNRLRGKLLGLGGGVLLLMAASVGHAGTVTYVYTDPQGTPLAEANASGTITATFDYAPYGSIALGTAPNGPGYTGHVNDPESGLVYMQARYYDPSVGRFLSTDPVEPSAGNAFNFNRYAYADNNPIGNTDPTGMFPSLEDVCSHSAFPCQTTTFGGGGGGGGSSSSAQTPASQAAPAGTKPAITHITDDNAPAPDSPVFPPEDVVAMRVFQAAAMAASDMVSKVPQPGRGTLVHTIFALLIGGLKSPLFTAEVSYLDHDYRGYGTKGSVRADGIFGPAGRPQIAVDVKTGNARMTNAEVNKYYDNLPLGTHLYQISVP